DLLTFKAAFKETVPTLLLGGAEGDSKTLLDAGDGIYLVTAFTSDLDMGRTKTFVSQYEAAYTEKPDVHAALAFDAARLFDEAFKRCEGSATPERFREK